MWHIPYKTPWNWNGTSKDLVSGFVKIWAPFNHSTFNERLDKRVTKCKFVTIPTTFLGKLTFVVILVFVIVVVVSETGIGRLRGSVIRLTNYLNDKTKTYREYLSWLPGSVKASQGGSPCDHLRHVGDADVCASVYDVIKATCRRGETQTFKHLGWKHINQHAKSHA